MITTCTRLTNDELSYLYGEVSEEISRLVEIRYTSRMTDREAEQLAFLNNLVEKLSRL